jgi:hypothetical protein
LIFFLIKIFGFVGVPNLDIHVLLVVIPYIVCCLTKIIRMKFFFSNGAYNF